MPQMMMDILQYVPYALFVGAVFLMIGGGLLYTFLYFKNVVKKAPTHVINFDKR